MAIKVYGQKQNTTPVPILRQINRHNEDGSYSYGYEGAKDSVWRARINAPAKENIEPTPAATAGTADKWRRTERGPGLFNLLL